MDLELSADQELFAETTRRFLEATCPIVEVRRLHDAGGGFDPGYWQQGAELGWTATLVAESDGGGSVSGDGLLDLVLVAEEMGRLVSPGPLVPVNVVADAVARRGTAEQRAAVLPGLVSGEHVATWAFAEEAATWDAAGVALRATEAGDGWLLAGTKTFVEDGAVADTFLVTARMGDGLTQFLVPGGTAGVRVTPLGSLDFTRTFARIDFDGATVPRSAVLGTVGDAGEDVERQLQVALALQNAETVGATTTVLDFTLEYAKDRVAFGRPIGSYQALKHRFADMRTWLEACHATATASAKAVQAGAPDASELTSVAKAYIADRCPAIIQDCVQLHGGIGVTWEHDLHLYLRRVAQNAALYGSVSQHRERVAALIGMQQRHDERERDAVTVTDETTMESVESFRARAAAWIPEHLPSVGATGRDNPVTRRLEGEDRDPDNSVARAKALQRIIYDGGFAGVCYPSEYGGLGLTPRHMAAFNRECRGYDLSGLSYYGMTFGMIGPTILDFGTDEQKERHIRNFLTGENIWIQFLSEPTGGSDLASVLTRADRDGDEWVVNGSKIWTSFGDIGDYGLLVARTNWDVPKHSGISVFICPVNTPGLEVQPLRLVTGSTGFCQEFFTDVRIPADNLLGTLNDGWTVASRLLVHERNSVGGGSQYWAAPFDGFGESSRDDDAPGRRRDDLVELADAMGTLDDPYTRQLVAEAYVAQTVGSQLGPRVAASMAKGVLPPPAGSFLKLFNTSSGVRRSDITMTIAGPGATVWEAGDHVGEGRGLGYLFRQAFSILSGTSEIQRNIISERVLGLPREPSLDSKVPFRDVLHNQMPSGRRE